MENTNELMDQYRHFLLTESESVVGNISIYGKHFLDDIAAINDGVYVAPAYELERFLAKILLDKDPKKYIVHRKITVGDKTIFDDDSFSKWFSEKVKPPLLQDYKHSRPDWPEAQADKMLDYDIASIIAELIEKKEIVKGSGYGLAKDKGDESYKSQNPYRNPFPFTVDEQIVETDNKTSSKKSRLCATLDQQRINVVRIIRVSDFDHCSDASTNKFSLDQLAHESIERLCWGLYHRSHSFCFVTYGCREL